MQTHGGYTIHYLITKRSLKKSKKYLETNDNENTTTLIYLNAILTPEDPSKKFSWCYFYIEVTHDYFTMRERGAFPLKKTKTKTFKVYNINNCSNTKRGTCNFPLFKWLLT